MKLDLSVIIFQNDILTSSHTDMLYAELLHLMSERYVGREEHSEMGV